MSPGVGMQAGWLGLRVVKLWLVHKSQMHLPGIQQDSFESLLMMLVHKYQVDFSDIQQGRLEAVLQQC